MRVDEQEPDKRRDRGTSKPCIAKSVSIKDGKRRSGDCAQKAAGITPGDLFCGRHEATGKVERQSDAEQKSAEGIVAPEKEGRPERKGARIRTQTS